jgi:hypothetical protein
MYKSNFLKLKSHGCIFLLGMLNIFAFSFLFGCSNTPDQKKDKTADSITRVKRINDSMLKEKHKQDSLQKIKRIQDSITKRDSIKKAKQINNNFKPIHHPTKYGPPPVKH